MRKVHGKIGYAIGLETTSPGVWEERIVERDYIGDLVTSRTRINQSSEINGSLTLSTTISAIVDQFGFQHCYNIRYITYDGYKWNVKSVEHEYPRVRVTIGEICHEE